MCTMRHGALIRQQDLRLRLEDVACLALASVNAVVCAVGDEREGALRAHNNVVADQLGLQLGVDGILRLDGILIQVLELGEDVIWDVCLCVVND